MWQAGETNAWRTETDAPGTVGSQHSTSHWEQGEDAFQFHQRILGGKICGARRSCRDQESVSWRNERKVPERSGGQGLSGPELGAIPQSRVSNSTPHVHSLSCLTPSSPKSSTHHRSPCAHALVSALLPGHPKPTQLFHRAVRKCFIGGPSKDVRCCGPHGLWFHDSTSRKQRWQNVI